MEERKGKRSQNWSSGEEVALIESVKQRADTLFGPFKGSGARGKQREIREREWQCIADALNSQFDSKRRDTQEVKKKYYNIKSRSKEKLDGMKRPKTGGGPPPPPFTPGEETFLQLSSGEPHLEGLEGGIDTDAPTVSSITVQLPENANKENVERNAQDLDSLFNTQTRQEAGTSSVSHKIKEKKGENNRRKREELEEEYLKLDNERLQQVILNAKKEREILDLQKEVLELKKQKLMLDIQTNYPEMLVNISSEL